MSTEMRSGAWRRDPRLFIAVAVTTLFNGSLLATGSHRGTYDAYVHLFFADHYARDWFSSWEPRWYTGFPVISYPPGVHQLLALLKGPLGSDGAYILVQTGALVLLIVGVYRFSHLWAGRRAAGWAAIAAALSSSLVEVVHVFGQLPTVMALALLLNAQPSVARWVEHGHRRDLVTALAFLAGTTSVHHVTTLFGSVFFTGPVVARVLLDAFRTPRSGEIDGHAARLRPGIVVGLVARRLHRMLRPIRRTIVLGATTITTLLVVILPYWLWSRRDPIAQVPIPHGSRDNFLENLDTGLVFWLLPWASVVLVLPFALAYALPTRRWPLAASVVLLFVLGTGGTTPIPRLLLGAAFDILTLDRFTVWATIAVLPLVGETVDRLVRADETGLFRRALGRRAATVTLGLLLLVALGSSVFVSALASLRPMQPDPVDPAPITTFLAKDDHDRWRYLFLGFGDQMAAISAETTALTVDGNYHSARRLPELTSRSVERLEGAKFRGVPGLGSLQQFLGNPGRYHLKFVFVNDAFYEPLLWASGWLRIGSLDNDVVVWERPDVAPLPAHEDRPEIPGWQRLLWGVLPITALLLAGGATASLARGQRRLDTRSTPLTRLDSVLDRMQERLEGAEFRPDRTRLVRLPTVPRFVDPVALLRTAVAGAAGLALLTGVAVLGGSDDLDPAQTVVAYYDHLDFQRFESAWELLDGATRPTLTDHLNTRSLRDGLLDGYAELDDIEITRLDVDGNTAVVTVRLRYLTSIEVLEVDRTHVLHAADGRWGLEYIAEPEPPAADFLRRSRTIDYLEVRQSVTDTGPILTVDRPTLSLGPATPLFVDDQWMVVGTVTNTDDVPAHVTLEATLRGEDGALLANAEATTHTTPTVFPGETVPYRIVFEGRAGIEDRSDPTAGDFDPDGFSPLVLDVPVAAIDVAARAVVTAPPMDRRLAVLDATTRPEPASVGATLVNTGTEGVTIAQTLLAVHDERGRVVWVETFRLDDALAPGERRAVVFPVAPPDGAQRVDIPVTLFADAVHGPVLRPDRIETPGLSGVESISLHHAAFRRGGTQ